MDIDLGIPTEWSEYRRVLNMVKTPDEEEFLRVAGITLAGIGLIGLIGFIIYTLMTFPT